MNSKVLRTVQCFLGAVVVPFLITWLCLYIFGRGGGGFSFALPFCLVVGLISMATLPIKTATRFILCVLYVPTLVFLLFLMTVMYVCGKFGDCL